MIEILISIILLPIAAVAAFFTLCFAIGLIGWGLGNLFSKRGVKDGINRKKNRTSRSNASSSDDE